MPKSSQAPSKRRGYKSKAKAKQLADARQAKEKQKRKADDREIDEPHGIAAVESCSQSVVSTPSSSSSPELLGSSAKKFKAFESKMTAAGDSESSGVGGGKCNGSGPGRDSATDSGTVSVPPLPTTICDLNQIANLFAACACPECGQSSIRLECDDGKKMGMAEFLRVLCSNCDTVIAAGHTSATLPGENRAFEVTRRTVTGSLLCGFGARKLNKFCEYLNLPGLSTETFKTHCEAVFELTPPLKRQLIELAVQAVREAHKEVTPNCEQEDGIIDIAVSFDGTWHTRGHDSKVGVACVIDLLTGICIDYHVMSKYCQTCETTGKRLKRCGENAYQVWMEEHKPNCHKNFDGSSGMMEVEGARTLWSRSVEQHKLRYSTLLSDGDTKTFLELTELKPYGDEVLVRKEECINHVSKRMGTALRNIVSDRRKQGVTLGGKGKGKLTQTTMKALQKHYSKAIKSNNTVETMSDAVWASFLHCTSTDEDPHHSRCPQGQDSWCFYNRALARGDPPPPHEDNLTTPLSREVAREVLPVYRKLTEPDLLGRCLRRKTQNANESLHGVIWSHCPKHTFASRAKVETATLVSVGEFNMGSTASHNFMTAQGLYVGENTKRLGQQRDRVREANSRRKADLKEQHRRKKVQQAKENERRRHLREEGGPAYAAGAF